MFNFPFSQAGGVSGVTGSALKSKLSFNGIVTNLEKTVSTINQVVPLYNQVKPLISNSKTIINAFKSNKDKQSPFKRKSRFTKNPYYQNNFKQEDIINVEIDQENKEEEIFTKKENDNITVFSSIDSPNKAFFI